MMRTLLLRGLLAGLVAGLVMWVFALVIGEPSVDAAIAFEEQLAAAGHHGEEVEVVARGVQKTIGLGVALILYGTAIGAVFAMVFAAAHGRMGRMSPRATSAVLAGLGLLVVFIAPFVKYPANPPAANNADTIGDRTTLYLTMLVVSILVAMTASSLAAWLRPRWGAWNATLAGLGAYLVTVTIVGTLLPAVDETPPDFPATVLYDFRVASISLQVLLCATLGIVFGWLADRALRTAGEVQPTAAAATR